MLLTKTPYKVIQMVMNLSHDNDIEDYLADWVNVCDVCGHFCQDAQEWNGDTLCGECVEDFMGDSFERCESCGSLADDCDEQGICGMCVEDAEDTQYKKNDLVKSVY